MGFSSTGLLPSMAFLSRKLPLTNHGLNVLPQKCFHRLETLPTLSPYNPPHHFDNKPKWKSRLHKFFEAQYTIRLFIKVVVGLGSSLFARRY